MSPAYETLFGRSCESLCENPRSWFDSLHPDDRAPTIEAIRRFESSPLLETRHPDYRIRRPDGTERVVRARLYKLGGEPEHPAAMAGILEDVTEQVGTERALLESERRYAEAARIARLGHWERNVAATRQTWSENVYRILAAPPGTDATMEAWFARIHPEDKPRVRDFVDRCRATGERGEATYRIERFDGEHRIFRSVSEVRRDASGTPCCIFGTIQDVTEIEEARDELHRARALAENILETAQAIVLVLDPRGHVVRANAYLSALVGRTTDEVGGRDWIDVFLKEEDRPRFRELLRETASGKTIRGSQHTLVTADGHERRIEWSATRSVNAQGTLTGIVAIGHDVTDRLETEAALRKSEEHLRLVTESSRDCFWLSTADRRTMLYVSPAFETIFGRPAAALSPSPIAFLDWVHPDDRSALARIVAEQTATPAPERSELEYRIVWPDGSVHWIWTRYFNVSGERGEPIRVAGVSADVTERKLAERTLLELNASLEQRVKARTAELQESGNRLRAIIDGIFPFVGLFALDGTILEVNEAPLAAAGLRREDVIGKPFAEAAWWSWSPDAQARIRDALRRAATGETVRFDASVLVAGGRVLTVDSSFGALRDGSGRIVQVVGSGVDVTERRQAEAELRTSLREKEVLMREIHHRVKNNLQTVSSLLYLQSTRSPANLASIFDTAIQRIRAMALIHEELYRGRDLSHVELGSYVSSLARQILTASSVDPGRVRLELALKEVAVALDVVTPCGLILHELLTNAIKHAFAGDRGGTIRLDLDRRDDAAFVTVEDDGVGFVPARATDRGGIGLELARRLARQLGGELTLSSRDPGTKVTVSFPLR